MSSLETTSAEAANHLARRYDRAAPRWAREIARLGYPQAYRLLATRGLAAIAPDSKARPLRILDAGCGSGDFSCAVAQVAPGPMAVDLVDLSPAMLARAKAALAGLAEANAICGDLDDVLLDGEGCYDLVLCAHVIEHVPLPEALLARLRRMASPRGALLLVANRPHWCTWLVQLRWRTRAYPPEQIAQWLGSAGFGRVEHVSFASGPPSRTSMGYLATL